MTTFYRVVYKTTTQTIKSPNFYDLQTAQTIADDLNRDFQQLGKYELESAEISTLTPLQITRLHQLKLITDKELATYVDSDSLIEQR